jgi:hypothetical protein
MRRRSSRYIGSADDGTLGNTPVVCSASAALEDLAKVVRGSKKDGSTRSETEACAVLIKQFQAWLEVSTLDEGSRHQDKRAVSRG